MHVLTCVFCTHMLRYMLTCMSAVTLVGVQDSFEGWILQAREPDSEDALLGTFLPDTETQQLVACDDLMNDEVQCGGGL